MTLDKAYTITKQEKIHTMLSSSHYLDIYYEELKSWIENCETIDKEYKDYMLAKIIYYKMNVREQIIEDLGL